MSVDATGRHRCDCCGTDLGNGGVAQCAIVSDLDPDRPGMIRNLHFCRDRMEEVDGQRTSITGCVHKLLTDEVLADYLAHKGENRG